MFASGYNNMAGYMVGVVFGYLYYNHKRDNMLTNKVSEINGKKNLTKSMEITFSFTLLYGG